MSHLILTEETSQAAPEQLRRAAEMIEENGHTRNKWTGLNGEMCLAHALVVAAGVTVPTEYGGGLKIMNEIGRTPTALALGMNAKEICDMNNEPGFDAPSWLREQADRLERV